MMLHQINTKGTPHLIFQTILTLHPLFQIFGTPNGHPKSQPFIDHVLTFSILDNRIWFRNYQILSEDGALAEIGKVLEFNGIIQFLIFFFLFFSKFTLAYLP